MSTEPHPIKVVNTAPSENIRANKIAIETAKTGKVTAVVVVMSIFCKKKCNSRSADSGDETLSRRGRKCQFPGGKFPWAKKPFSGNKERPVTSEISI